MHKATIHTHVVEKFRTNFTTEKQGSTYMRVFIWSTTFPGLPMQVDG